MKQHHNVRASSSEQVVPAAPRRRSTGSAPRPRARRSPLASSVPPCGPSSSYCAARNPPRSSGGTSATRARKTRSSARSAYSIPRPARRGRGAVAKMAARFAAVHGSSSPSRMDAAAPGWSSSNERAIPRHYAQPTDPGYAVSGFASSTSWRFTRSTCRRYLLRSPSILCHSPLGSR